MNEMIFDKAEYLLVMKPGLNNVIVKFGQFPSI